MKKTILLIAGLLMFAFLATGCLGGTEVKDEEAFNPETLQEQLDIATALDAIQLSEPELCETIGNEEQKEECLQRIEYNETLKIARDNVDIKKCDEIDDANTKDKCEILVQKELDGIAKEVELQKELEEKQKIEDEMNKIREEDEAKLNELLQGSRPTAEDCEILIDQELKESCLGAAAAFNEQ
jgi:hypothetical protein